MGGRNQATLVVVAQGGVVSVLSRISDMTAFSPYFNYYKLSSGALIFPYINITGLIKVSAPLEMVAVCKRDHLNAIILSAFLSASFSFGQAKKL